MPLLKYPTTLRTGRPILDPQPPTASSNHSIILAPAVIRLSCRLSARGCTPAFRAASPGGGSQGRVPAGQQPDHGAGGHSTPCSGCPHQSGKPVSIGTWIGGVLYQYIVAYDREESDDYKIFETIADLFQQ